MPVIEVDWRFVSTTEKDIITLHPHFYHQDFEREFNHFIQKNNPCTFKEFSSAVQKGDLKFLERRNFPAQYFNFETPYHDCDALNLAALQGDRDVLYYLLNQIDSNKLKVSRKTILHSAVMGRQVDLAKDLMRNSALDLDAEKADRSPYPNATALEIAVEEELDSVVKSFFQYGPSLTTLSKAMMRVVVNGNLNIAELFLDKGFDVNTVCNDRDETILHLIIKNNQVKILKFLLEKKLDLNLSIQDKLGKNFFHVGVKNGHYSVVQCLLETTKFDINTRTRDGETALHLAAYYGNEKMVKLLLQHGIDPELVDKDNMIAAEVAKEHHKYDVAALIEAHIKKPKQGESFHCTEGEFDLLKRQCEMFRLNNRKLTEEVLKLQQSLEKKEGETKSIEDDLKNEKARNTKLENQIEELQQNISELVASLKQSTQQHQKLAQASLLKRLIFLVSPDEPSKEELSSSTKHSKNSF